MLVRVGWFLGGLHVSVGGEASSLVSRGLIRPFAQASRGACGQRARCACTVGSSAGTARTTRKRTLWHT